MKNIKDLATSIGLTITVARVDENPHMAADVAWHSGASHYFVTLKRDREQTGENIPRGRKISLFYSMGSAHRNPPKAVDVLDCLLSDASFADASFEDFCSELGYDSDSRAARKTWKQTVKQTAKLRTFLGDDFDAFINAERL